VIVINAKDVQLTGGKYETKVAYRHSGYPGGLTETKYAKLLAEKPAFAVEKAIRGMLPKNRLGRAMGKKLQVYAGGEHPHQAQQPKPLALGEVPPWDGLPAPKPKPQRTEKAETKRPASKRSSAKPTTAKSTAKRSSSTSTAKKTTAKRTTAKAATSSAKKKSTAKRLTSRRKKEE
jgi:hypothetical protein